MGQQARGPNSLSDGSVSSGLSGNAQDVVQARDISGGVHFHTAMRREMPIPRQLPADVSGFVGRVGPLEQLTVLAGDDTASDGRLIVIADVEVIDAMVAPLGIPAPTTAMPTTRSAVVASPVMTLVLIVFVAVVELYQSDVMLTPGALMSTQLP